jgi:hypothetical protein
MTPDTLCQHLKENALLPKDTGTLTLTKDNHAVEAIFQAHMLQLLGYENLPKDEQLLLSFIALAPESGFPLNLLHKWCGNYSSRLDSLVQKGLINSNYGVAALITGYITQNIVALYHKIGNIKAALIMYHTAESILLKHLGDEHEDVILCREQAFALDTTGDISLIDVPKIEHKFIA